MLQLDGDEAHHDWTTALETCFRRRLRPEATADALRELGTQHSIKGLDLAAILLQSGSQPVSSVDPLVSPYLSSLLQEQLLDTGDILRALLESSQFATKTSATATDTQTSTSLASCESVLNLLSNLYGLEESARPKSISESRKTYHALVMWLKACNAYETMLQIDSGGLSALDPATVAIFEALGTFTVLMMNNATTKAHLKKSISKAQNDDFANVLTQFASTLSPYSQLQIPSKLQVVARNAQLAASANDESIDFTVSEISDAVSSLPMHISRAGMYVYLNAALGEKPTFDDAAIINHLHARYPSDPQAMVIQLIVAAFDALGNALHRHESEQNVLCYRSFVANKLPLLLQPLSSALYPPTTLEHCVQMAMARIEVHPFPPLSSDSHGINGKLRDCKHEFIYACHLHQLLSENAVATALQQQSPAKIPKVIRCNKDTLTMQCTSNVHKAEEIINELDKMQGNAGTVAVVLVEVLQHHCNSKETMSLKTLCNALSRRVHLVDIILQYIVLGQILTPLCNVLDTWTTDDDRSELQPAYEEFSAILLLVLALCHRYEIDPAKMVSRPEAFVTKLLTNFSESMQMDQLTEEQSSQLAKWIKGLYATDDKGETTGISDETMSGCPPQAFYLLVPTLFEQSVGACKNQRLDLKILEGGLEFLLEPFLLPSVVGGLGWITKHCWEDHKDGEILLHVLDKLLRPSSMSGDAQSMHKTILTMTAKPLLHCLQQVETKVPNKKWVGELRQALQPYTEGQRTFRSTIRELKEWSGAAGGLRQSIIALVSQLSAWSSQSDLTPIPPNYTHRHVAATIDIIGADETLMAIVDEIAVQTTIGLGANALEVGAALICAPNRSETSSMPSLESNRLRCNDNRLSLRQALKLRLDDSKALLDTHLGQVEALIRLGRLVEAQSVITQIPQVSLPLTNMGTDELMEGIDISGTDMAAAAQASMDQAAANLDGTSAADFDAVMDQSLDLGNTNGGGMDGVDDDPNAMNIDLGDDLFGTGQDIDFSLDTGSQLQTQQQQAQDVAGNIDGTNAAGAAQSLDEDIFAGLDFGGMGDGMGDDDFNF